VCEEGYGGEGCGEKLKCEENCLNGVCDEETCTCDEGWEGPLCDVISCPKDCTAADQVRVLSLSL